MAIESLRALMEAGENQDLCDIIIHSDCVDRGVTKEASFEKMRALYAAIRRARAGYDPALRSASGMVGGDGAKMRAYVQSGKTIWGQLVSQLPDRARKRAGHGRGVLALPRRRRKARSDAVVLQDH